MCYIEPLGSDGNKVYSDSVCLPARSFPPTPAWLMTNTLCAACTVAGTGATRTLPAIADASLAQLAYVKVSSDCLSVETCVDIPLGASVSGGRSFLMVWLVCFCWGWYLGSGGSG